MAVNFFLHQTINKVLSLALSNLHHSWYTFPLSDTEAPGHYDPAQRNPLHSRAELDCLWELERLGAHYHPSVALFAGTILKVQSVFMLPKLALTTSLTHYPLGDVAVI